MRKHESLRLSLEYIAQRSKQISTIHSKMNDSIAPCEDRYSDEELSEIGRFLETSHEMVDDLQDAIICLEKTLKPKGEKHI